MFVLKIRCFTLLYPFSSMTIKEYLKLLNRLYDITIRYNLVWVSLRLINREAVYEKRKLTQTRLCKHNHRHSKSGPPFFLIWSLPRLWYGSLSGSIYLNHLSIFYNCQNTKRESSLRLDILQ